MSHTLRHSWSRSTFKAYSRSVQDFNVFCDKEDIASHFRLPASEYLLCAFAASKAGHLSGTTIQKRLTALKAWHSIQGVKWKGNRRLRLIIQGAKNLTPTSSKKPPCPPIDHKMLKALVQHLVLDDPLDATIASCASSAFWGQCRLGELLGNSRTSFVTTSIPKRTNLRRSIQNRSSYILHIPRTKTSRHGEDIILVEQPRITDSIYLLRRHLKINLLDPSFPLFCYQTPNGPLALTKRTFLARCNSIWSILGHPSVTGHSFRIGGTTELLLAGVPPDIVKTMGRWKSDAFLPYWRQLEKVAPHHVKKCFSRHLSHSNNTI